MFRKARSSIPTLFVLVVLAWGCSAGGLVPESNAPEAGTLPPSTPMASNVVTNPQGGSLFLDTDQTGTSSNGPGVTRSRWVKIDGALLLDAQGAARSLPPHAEITLNLFPDATYTAVIEQVQDDGGSISWVGSLKSVDTSEFTLVYTGGVFAGHFASPGSVYEVASDGGDLYRIVQIDQQKLPGGEGDITPTTGP